MENCISLDKICPGERGVVTRLDTTGAMRRRFLDIGLICDTEIECVGRSPSGDPSAYLIRGAVIAIRAENCADIFVRPTTEEKQWD